MRAWAQYAFPFGLAPRAIKQAAVKDSAPQEHSIGLNPEPRWLKPTVAPTVPAEARTKTTQAKPQAFTSLHFDKHRVSK